MSASKQMFTWRPLSGMSSQSPSVASRDRQFHTPASAAAHCPREVSESAFLTPSQSQSGTPGSVIRLRHSGCTSTTFGRPVWEAYLRGLPDCGSFGGQSGRYCQPVSSPVARYSGISRPGKRASSLRAQLGMPSRLSKSREEPSPADGRLTDRYPRAAITSSLIEDSRS